MAKGGSYTKKNKDAKPKLVGRTKTIAEATDDLNTVAKNPADSEKHGKQGKSK